MNRNEQDGPLWEPAPAAAAASRMAEFMRWLGQQGIVRVDDFHALWTWSVEDLDGYWRALWSFFDLGGLQEGPVLPDARMPGAVWFPGAAINFAAEALRGRGQERPALISVCEEGSTQTWSTSRLSAEAAAFADLLVRLGVEPGDRVVGYMPNIPHAVAALLGAASIGAIWSVCNQDLAVGAVVDRFEQLSPKVLVAADGSHHNGRAHNQMEAVSQLKASLPTLQAAVVVQHVGTTTPSGVTAWPHAQEGARLDPRPLPFHHPLWILFSSGTTGRPKGILHGHGGIVLEELAFLGLHLDLGPGDRFLWHTSTSWVMWNNAVAALLTGATVVLYEGSPTYPNAQRLWQLAEDHQATLLGTSPAYLHACRREGTDPRDGGRGLEALRRVGVTGSPLTADTHRWLQTALGPGAPVHSLSGGTDLAGPLVIGNPMTPEYAGEIGGRCLGAAVSVFDEQGRPVVGEMGEMVVTQPVPSMPLSLWGDRDGSRYRDAYFSTFPGVWRQGDWMTLSARGSVTIHGRSDATLNRRGIRLGTAEIYRAVEAFEEIVDALVVGVEQSDGGYWMPLFVQLSAGSSLDERLTARLALAVKAEASPQHVPDEIIAVRGIPRTLTGKRLEVPVKRILLGAAPGDVVEPGSVDVPGFLDDFAALAVARRTSA